MDKQFEKAVLFVREKKPPIKLDNETKLYFYAVFKQATVGECDQKTAPGSMFDIVSKLKWEKWKSLGSMSKDEAKTAYINRLTQVAPDWKSWNENEQLVQSSLADTANENTSNRLKFWGWGYENVVVDSDLVDNVKTFLQHTLHILESEWRFTEAPSLQSITLRFPRFQLPNHIRELCSDSKYDRILHSFGRSYRDVVMCLRGDFVNVTDYVAFPKTEDQILELFKFSQENNVAVIPFGGGTTVVGGVQPPTSTSYRGSITISMKHFNKVKLIDTASRSALIQAGTFGPSLEQQLKDSGTGFTLRHFPQSFEFSTLGGWIATRGGGHYATMYTHIDDFVESVRVVTPNGVVHTNKLPASGAGPSADRLFIGSEGTLGIITEAWMRLQTRPQFRSSGSVLFDSFMEGAKAVREISQSGIYPTNCRLIDPVESLYMGIGSGDKAVLLLGFESFCAENFDYQMSILLRICQNYGGQWDYNQIKTKSVAEERDSTTEGWKSSFLKAPYMRDVLVQHGLIVETFETACTWENWEEFHAEIINSVMTAIHQYCDGKGLITCRFTHVYPDGPAPYYSVIALGKEDMELEQWDQIKKAASDAILRKKGTITHHHSVGKHHQSYYAKQEDNLFLRALKGAKTALDPFWILNPGVLFTEEEAAKEAQKRSNLWSWMAWPTALAVVGAAASYATSVYLGRRK